MIEPVKLKSEFSFPTTTALVSSSLLNYAGEVITQAHQQEYMWLKHVLDSLHGNEETAYCSWAAYHADTSNQTMPNKSVNALLPLFSDVAHSDATILHSMKVVKNCVDYLNPGQTPVLACDQPLFAIAKMIQWKLPEQYGEDKFVIMLLNMLITSA